MAYTILRMSGYSPAEAYELLGTMREETKKGVGDWRIELAEKYLVPHLIWLIGQKWTSSNLNHIYFFQL